MTAEIVILSPEAVALAADSAVTFRTAYTEKISTSANKLFSLSNHHPVGIMIYGNATFMDVPWETIIKVFRAKRIPKNGFVTLREYGEEFISFLAPENIPTNDSAEENHVIGFVFTCLETIGRSIERIVNDRLVNTTSLSEDDIKQLSQRLIKQRLEDLRKTRSSTLVTKRRTKKVLETHKKAIDSDIREFVREYRLDAKEVDSIWEIITLAMSYVILENYHTGIVVAGFGENELTPSTECYLVEGLVGGKLKYIRDNDNCLHGHHIQAAVVPFAQKEMVDTFMTGVDPRLAEFEYHYLSEMCEDYARKVVARLKRYNKKEKDIIRQNLIKYGHRLTREFFDKTEELRKVNFIDPTVDAVSRLHKNELAAMAEALVYLTALKHKVSLYSETVAEPIDVAVISKGDGFVWIKRKHYFSLELNPMFSVRYYRGILDEYEWREKQDANVAGDTSNES